MTNITEKATTVFACCSRSGVVSFHATVPPGQIKLAHGPEERLRLAIESLVRRSTFGDIYMVDSVRKAANDEAASQAAWDFAAQIAEQLDAKEAA